MIKILMGNIETKGSCYPGRKGKCTLQCWLGTSRGEDGEGSLVEETTVWFHVTMEAKGFDKWYFLFFQLGD